MAVLNEGLSQDRHSCKGTFISENPTPNVHQTSEDDPTFVAELSVCLCSLPVSDRPLEIQAQSEWSEHLGLIEEWRQLTPADVYPVEHAWNCSFLEAKRLVRAGDQDAAAEILAKSCVYPNTNRSHFVLLFRLWRRRNTLDKKARRYEEIRSRVLAMMRKEEEFLCALALEFTETHEGARHIETFEGSRHLSSRDMMALLRAAIALDDADLASLAREWIRRHKMKP